MKACSARAAGVALLLASWAAGAQAQTFIASGQFQYVDKGWNFDGWTGLFAQRPIRRANVYVLNNQSGQVLGQGSTAEDGSYAIACTSAGFPDVVVRCDSDTELAGGQRVRVVMEPNAEYAAFSPVFPGHSPTMPLHAGTVTAQPITTPGGKQGNPFNLLDMGVAAAGYVTGPAVGATPSPQVMRLLWPAPGSTFTAGTTSNLSEDDGYDDSVILHEIGHLVHNIYSQSDNPGGPHTFGFSDQDPRLAFSEGYATFFAGLVLNSLGQPALYVDADGGKSQPFFFWLRLELESVAPWAALDFGEADEVAVACTLHDMLDDETWLDGQPGDDDPFLAGSSVAGLPLAQAWWNDFVGPIKSAINLTLCDAWDGWFALYAGEAQLPEMMATWENRRIRFWSDSQEPDNALAAGAPTAAGSASLWSPDRTLYFSAANPPAPGTGDQDHYAVPLVKGDVVNVQTRYPGGAIDADTACDPFLDVYDPGGQLAASAEGGGVGRNALIGNLAIDETGTWTCVVRTTSSFRRYGRYNVQCAYVSQNHPPQITSGPTAAPSTITSSQTATLSVLATDADPGQTLGYAWTPLNGGAIVGSGPSVTFVPPGVASTTLVGVQVIVSDSLGAESAPGSTTITVEPGAGPVCPAPALAVSGGTPKPGLLGPPLLAALNLPQVPSSNFALQLSNALPNLPGYLVFGFSMLAAPFDGGTLYPSPDILLPVTAGPSGQLLFPIAIGADAIVCGFTIHAQVLLPDDPGAAGFRKTAQTNFVSFTFGS